MLIVSKAAMVQQLPPVRQYHWIRCDKHKDNQCQFWHYFNPESSKYECYSDPNIGNKVRCKKQGIIELRVGHCMTYEEQERAIYIASCGLTDDFTKNSNGRYIELPVQNVSELNTHMCGPMNRRGRLCSECIEGFGASVISSNFDIMYSKCTGAWYGIPLYLFLEFVPITVFFTNHLLFRVNVTSAPVVAFVFSSQIIVPTFLNYGTQLQFEHPTAHIIIHIIVTFYGFWNLDFFRHILPPFCISPELKHMHVVLIDYISAFYPLCLISITWIIIKLHFHNFKPVVWRWSKLSKCSCIQDRNVSRSNSLIDVFTTFFLLSYSKLVYTSSLILYPLNVVMYRNTNFSNNHFLSAADARTDYFS